VARADGLTLPGRLVTGRGDPGLCTQVARGREAGHVDPHLGDHHLGGGPRDPGNRAQEGDRRLKRTQAIRHVGCECGNGAVQEVDVLDHLATDEGMVGAETTAECFFELGDLGS